MQDYQETPSRVMDSLSKPKREERNKKKRCVQIEQSETRTPVYRLKARPNKTESKKPPPDQANPTAHQLTLKLEEGTNSPLTDADMDPFAP